MTDFNSSTWANVMYSQATAPRFNYAPSNVGPKPKVKIKQAKQSKQLRPDSGTLRTNIRVIVGLNPGASVTDIYKLLADSNKNYCSRHGITGHLRRDVQAGRYKFVIGNNDTKHYFLIDASTDGFVAPPADVKTIKPVRRGNVELITKLLEEHGEMATFEIAKHIASKPGSLESSRLTRAWITLRAMERLGLVTHKRSDKASRGLSWSLVK